MRLGVLFTILFVSATTFVRADEVRLSPPFTKGEARRFVTEKWFPAWAGGAPAVEGLLTFFAPDATYVDPNVPKGIQGTVELRRFFTLMLGNNPNWKFRLVDAYPIDDGIVIHWLASIPHGDKVIENFRGVDIMTFADGKVTRLEEFFDLSVFQ